MKFSLEKLNLACYLITYDLVGPKRDYDGLIAAIKKYGTWAHITESNWAVVSESKAKDIRSNLKQYLNENDRIFVVKSATEAAWSNVICRNEWLKKHL